MFPALRHIVKNGIGLTIAFFLIFQLQAQPYGNEWIESSQSYFKLSVTQTGIHRVTYSDLNSAGAPVASIDPRNFQIWHRGQEISISVFGESDGVFSLGEYISFYAEKNDGTMDTSLYTDPVYHLNPYYNIYSDTAAYFLTWGSAGNRVTPVNIASVTAPIAYHFAEDVVAYSSVYVRGTLLSGTQSYESYWNSGEGWCGGNFYYIVASNQKLDYNYTFNVENVQTSGVPIEFEIKLTGRNNNFHASRLHLGTGVDEQTFDLETFSGYTAIDTVISGLGTSIINGNQLNVTVECLSDGVNTDNQSPVYLRLRYPQETDMSSASSKYFVLPSEASDTSVVSIQNPVNNIQVWDITDETAIVSPTGTLSAEYEVVVTGTSVERKLYAFDSTIYESPVEIKSVSFVNDTADVYDYLIITHPTLADAVVDYEDYRESTEGGGYNVHTADIERLYNQYSYGEKTPQAIRNYVRYMVDNNLPDYLFIVGKGTTVDFQVGSRPYYRKDNTLYSTKDLIPTYGVPGSDISFVNFINGSEYEPIIPVGRYSAKTSEQVTGYLNKVIEHEALAADALWRKNLVHLSGGTSTEADLFLNYVNGFKAIAEGPLLGGSVTTFSKSSSAEVEFFNIAEAVNSGLQLITFFGHSSSVVADIDIGFASRVENGYVNKGKYPALLINGCSSGNMYVGSSLGEDWITTSEKGALHVIAHSDLGYASEFKKWTEQFYYTAYTDTNFFGKSIGQIHKETMRRFDSVAAGNRAHVHLQQMNLQGDPAVSLFPAQKPDLFIDDSRVSLNSYTSDPVTAVSDSFYIQLIVSNYGLATTDSFAVCISRSYNNGQNLVEYGPMYYPGVLYQDTLLFPISSKDVETYGQNSFTITVDCQDTLDELSEINNVATLDYFMPLSGVNTIFPPEFSIVGQDTVTFVAQSTDLLISENTEYVFQLDTNDLFPNPLIELEATSGALVTWPDITLPHLADSLVYYWRVRFKNVASGEDTLWALSSFTYIPDQEGWSQSHFQQYRKDPVVGISKDFDNYEWVFDSTSSQVTFSTGGHGIDHKVSVISVNGQALYEWGNSNNCRKDGFLVVAFDKTSALPFHPNGFDLGNCGNSPKVVSEYSNFTAAANLTKLYDYLGKLKVGDYVFFQSIGNNAYSSWSQALKDTLAVYGADSVDFLTNGAPYVFLGRKGIPDDDFEIVGISSNETISSGFELSGQQIYATITSPLIGPASIWGTYYHKFERMNTDLFEVNIYGVNLDETETLLATMSNVTYDSLDLNVLASAYPYVKLEAIVSDSTSLDAPQLKKWLVVYTGVPEGTINASVFGLDEYSIEDTQIGDSLSLNLAFQNIGSYDFTAPLIVRYTITNESGAISTIDDTLSALPSGDTLLFSLNLSTVDYSGENSLHIYVNPKIVAEQLYSNNVLVLDFSVQEDDLHPVLDVVFDGQHILDGEIVSASPYITITMHDENEFFYKTDTVGIDIFLKRPCEDPDPLTGCPFEKISLEDPSVVSWTPAGPSTDFKVEYNPKNLEDGVYMLMAQVEDASGNKSGIEPYKINFEVINEASVTNVLPYPNPFSTSTRFVFTLTGSEVPDQMKIQIMTVSGKVVRTITQDELGPIRIGNNITEFAWDGTDEYGDRLANGTYLYKVDINSNGDGIKHRETKADQGFKRNFGKIVIIR